MTDVELAYRSPDGQLIDLFHPEDFYRLEYGRSERSVGSFYLDLKDPEDRFPLSIFRPDYKFEISLSSSMGAGKIDGETAWWTRLVRPKYDENGKRFLHIVAYDNLHQIDRRIVAYPAETAYTEKTTYADNMIKAIFRENFGALATDTARNLSAYFSCQADLSLAPSVSKNFAWQKCLPLFQEICRLSEENGTYLSFDLISLSPTTYEFRTYVTCRGINRGIGSPSPLILKLHEGLNYASIAYDRMSERNYIYAAGRGEGEDRNVQQVYDSQAVGISPFNRMEDYYPCTQAETTVSVTAEGHKRLREASARIAFNGHIQQQPGLIFGVDYGFGDIVVAEYQGQAFDCHLDAYKVTIDSEGDESIDIYARNLDDTEY